MEKGVGNSYTQAEKVKGHLVRDLEEIKECVTDFLGSVFQRRDRKCKGMYLRNDKETRACEKSEVRWEY